MAAMDERLGSFPLDSIQEDNPDESVWIEALLRFSPTVHDTTPMPAVRLSGARGWAATAACSSVLLLSVGIPVVAIQKNFQKGTIYAGWSD